MIKFKVQMDKVYPIIKKKDKLVYLIFNQIYLDKVIKTMAQIFQTKQKAFLILKKMKIVKCLMITILRNQKLCQDLG